MRQDFTEAKRIADSIASTDLLSQKDLRALARDASTPSPQVVRVIGLSLDEGAKVRIGRATGIDAQSAVLAKLIDIAIARFPEEAETE